MVSLDLCAECCQDIAPAIPRVVSKVSGYTWHVMCTPPLDDEEKDRSLSPHIRRFPREMVRPDGRTGRPRKDEVSSEL